MIIEYVGFFAYLCTVHKLLTIIGIFLCLVLLGCKDQQNQEDSLMTNDTLAIGLCDYFDGRRTPNERMLAHYILARTYVDMNEIPQALEELQKAVASADTTAADCDQRLLARVHRQASLLKEQSSGASHLYLWLLIGGFVVLCVGAMLLLRRKKAEKVEVSLPQEVMPEETSVDEKMMETEAYLRLVPNLGINFGLCFQIPWWYDWQKAGIMHIWIFGSYAEEKREVVEAGRIK